MSADGKFTCDGGEAVFTIDGKEMTGTAQNNNTYNYDRFDIKNFDGNKWIRFAQWQNCVVVGDTITIADYSESARNKEQYNLGTAAQWITLANFGYYTSGKTDDIMSTDSYVRDYMFKKANVTFESWEGNVLTIRFSIIYYDGYETSSTKRQEREHVLEGFMALHYVETPMQICTVCHGSGACQVCLGLTMYGDNCTGCHGSKECKYCDGEGKK